MKRRDEDLVCAAKLLETEKLPNVTMQRSGKYRGLQKHVPIYLVNFMTINVHTCNRLHNSINEGVIL